MNIQNEKTAVEKLLHGYSTALNSRNIDIIRSFYTEDGLLMPNGYNELTMDNLLKRSKLFFKKVQFKNYYDSPEITFGGEYAFLKTTAKTTIINHQKNTEVNQSSRDFFVFRKEKEDWKIYRYIFNEIKAN